MSGGSALRAIFPDLDAYRNANEEAMKTNSFLKAPADEAAPADVAGPAVPFSSAPSESQPVSSAPHIEGGSTVTVAMPAVAIPDKTLPSSQAPPEAKKKRKGEKAKKAPASGSAFAGKGLLDDSGGSLLGI